MSLPPDISSGIQAVQDALDNLSHSFAPFLDQERRINLNAFTGPKKQKIVDHYVSTMRAVGATKIAWSALSEAIKINKHAFHNTEKIAELLTDKLAEQSNKLITTLSNSHATSPGPQKTNVTPTTPNDQVLIIKNINKEDIKEDGTKKTFAAALQDNLNKELAQIPVTKATISNHDEAVLKFPSVQSCEDAKNQLKNVYNVSNSTRKQPIILPRIKIHHIDPSLAQMDKHDLGKRLMLKNPWIGDATNLEVTFVDKTLCFAVAKVSPNTYQRLMSDGRIFLDLSSHKITEHFAPIQCFKCQEFGHISGAPFCRAKDSFVCLYCSGKHKSADCQLKKDKTSHKCSNCEKNSNSTIKKNARGHSSTNKQCPCYINEVDKLKKLTCLDQGIFAEYLSNKSKN